MSKILLLNVTLIIATLCSAQTQINLEKWIIPGDILTVSVIPDIYSKNKKNTCNPVVLIELNYKGLLNDTLEKTEYKYNSNGYEIERVRYINQYE